MSKDDKMKRKVFLPPQQLQQHGLQQLQHLQGQQQQQQGLPSKWDFVNDKMIHLQQQQHDLFVSLLLVAFATVVPLQVRFCWGSGSFGGCITAGTMGGVTGCGGATTGGFGAGTANT